MTRSRIAVVLILSCLAAGALAAAHGPAPAMHAAAANDARAEWCRVPPVADALAELCAFFRGPR